MSGAEIFQVLEGHVNDVTGCDFCSNKLATCSADKSIKLWLKDSDGKFQEAPFSPLLGHTYGVNCVRFSPYGTLLASCSIDGRVIFWNIQTGEKVSEIQHSTGSPIRVCSFSPSSAILATGSDDEQVILWDIATKSLIRGLEGHESMITSLAFTPDSAFLVSCSTDGAIMLWDARYGHGKSLFFVNDAHDLGATGSDFSPQYEATSENGFLSGSYILATCGNDDLVKLWFVKTGLVKSISLSMTLEGHTSNVLSCRFSSAGTFLASTAGDKVAILWNPNTGKALQKLKGHSRYVICCAFADSSAMLATGSNDKTVIIWSLEKEKLLDSLGEMQLSDNQRALIYNQDFIKWNIDDVINWVTSLELTELADVFRKHNIDGKELMYLTHENLLTSMKIESLGQRNKILRGIQLLKNPLWQHVSPDSDDNMILDEFFCPITHEVMTNPVVAADGYSYEQCAIQEWYESGNERSPLTNEILSNKLLIPNKILLQLIKKYKM